MYADKKRTRVEYEQAGSLVNKLSRDYLWALICITLAVWVAYNGWLMLKPAALLENKPVATQMNGENLSAQNTLKSTSNNGQESNWTQPSTTQMPAKSNWAHSSEELIKWLSAPGYREKTVLTPNDISELHQYLDELTRQREEAIPAIYDFLKSKADVDFTAFKGGKKSRYASLRLALFDVLRRIGSVEAESIWFDVLQETNQPLEIATLGRYLEEQSPGAYRKDILKAAQNTFLLVSDDGINGMDTGPIFQVFQDYGDRSLLTDLEQASLLRWGNYASVAMANLPDGIGIPSLRRIVHDTPSGNLSARFALEMLAHHAEHPGAQATLIDGVRENQIPDYLWHEFAQIISGAYQIQMENPHKNTINKSNYEGNLRVTSVRKMTSFGSGGGQVLYGLRLSSVNLSPELAAQRLDFVAKLLDETSNPTAIQALEEAYEMLWYAAKEY